jgi:N-acetylglucosamine-6-phosphate deacetylase
MTTSHGLPEGVSQQQLSNATVLTAGTVITGRELFQPGWVAWSDGQVLAAGHGTPPRAADLKFPDSIVAPGFVDTHVHGAVSFEFGANQENNLAIRAAHLAAGTTSQVASLVSVPKDVLDRQIRSLAEQVADGHFIGIHLEGPWLSVEHHGAQASDMFRIPTREDVQSVLDAGAGRIASITIAPELEGGLEAVRRIVDSGAVASVGHTHASYAETHGALAAGARGATHLFNAMRGVHHREPGPVVALLEHDQAFVELIADGNHLHPAIVEGATRGRARPVLISDALAAALYGDGDFRLGELDVVAKDGRATVRGTDTLAGSLLSLAQAVKFTVGVAGVPLFQAVQAASINPADEMGRTDIGRLTPGARADLVLLDSTLDVTRVLHGGSWVEAE